MAERKYTPCAQCGTIEVEPFTPARFDAMQYCQYCDEPTCVECGESDAEYVNDGWRGTITCFVCRDRMLLEDELPSWARTYHPTYGTHKPGRGRP